jgi:glycolate oxidase
LYGGWFYDNLLGMEWVMPTGEIFKTGSLGFGSGWFCGEGPGPSMKGVARGFLGAKGSMGVFTKCAVKLFAWPGPQTLPVEGIIPAYKAALPENFKAYTVAFPSWKAWADAVYAIWDTGIGYLAHRQFNMFGRDLKFAMVKILTDPTKTLGDLEELLEDPEVQHVTEQSKRDFQIVLVGMTPRDMAWQEKALDEILARTGGWKVEAMNEPEIHDWALLYLIRLGHKNLNLVFGGSYDGCFGLLGAPDYGTSNVEEAGQFKKEWEQHGAIVEAGGDCMMGPIGGQGGGGTCLWENFTCFDPSDKFSTEGTLEFFDAATEYGIKQGWGVGMEKWNSQNRGPDGRTTPKEERDRIHLSAPQPNVFRYQHKVREALNPNDLGDAYFETLDD